MAKIKVTIEYWYNVSCTLKKSDDSGDEEFWITGKTIDDYHVEFTKIVPFVRYRDIDIENGLRKIYESLLDEKVIPEDAKMRFWEGDDNISIISGNQAWFIKVRNARAKY